MQREEKSMEKSFNIVCQIKANGFNKDQLDNLFFSDENIAKNYIEEMFKGFDSEFIYLDSINQLIVTTNGKTSWIQIVTIPLIA